MPSVDVYDRGDSIQVKADLPGVDPDKLEVDIQDNVLTIKGRRHEERRAEHGGYYRVEREFGEFQRAIGLPQDARTEDIDASYEDGVLTVTIPKEQRREAQRVQVRSSGRGRQQVEAQGPTREDRGEEEKAA